MIITLFFFLSFGVCTSSYALFNSLLSDLPQPHRGNQPDQDPEADQGVRPEGSRQATIGQERRSSRWTRSADGARCSESDSHLSVATRRKFLHQYFEEKQRVSPSFRNSSSNIIQPHQTNRTHSIIHSNTYPIPVLTPRDGSMKKQCKQVKNLVKVSVFTLFLISRGEHFDERGKCKG